MIARPFPSAEMKWGPRGAPPAPPPHRLPCSVMLGSSTGPSGSQGDRRQDGVSAFRLLSCASAGAENSPRPRSRRADGHVRSSEPRRARPRSAAIEKGTLVWGRSLGVLVTQQELRRRPGSLRAQGICSVLSEPSGKHTPPQHQAPGVPRRAVTFLTPAPWTAVLSGRAAGARRGGPGRATSSERHGGFPEAP